MRSRAHSVVRLSGKAMPDNAPETNNPKICVICHVTKFVSDNAINRCSFCDRAFCSRCGLRITRTSCASSSDAVNSSNAADSAGSSSVKWCCYKCRTAWVTSKNRLRASSLNAREVSCDNDSHDCKLLNASDDDDASDGDAGKREWIENRNNDVNLQHTVKSKESIKFRYPEYETVTNNNNSDHTIDHNSNHHNHIIINNNSSNDDDDQERNNECDGGWVFDETTTYATTRIFVHDDVWVSRQDDSTILFNPSGVLVGLETVVNAADERRIVPMLVVATAASTTRPKDLFCTLRRGDRILEWNNQIISQLSVDNQDILDILLAEKLKVILVLRIQSPLNFGPRAQPSKKSVSHVAVESPTQAHRVSGARTRMNSMSCVKRSLLSEHRSGSVDDQLSLPQHAVYPQPKIQLGLLHDQSSLTLLVSIFKYQDCLVESWSSALTADDDHRQWSAGRQCYLICRVALIPDPNGQFLRLHTRPMSSSMRFIQSGKSAVSFSAVIWNENLSFHPLSIADLVDFSLLVSVFSYCPELRARYQLVGQRSLELTQYAHFGPLSETKSTEAANWFLLSNVSDSSSTTTPTVSTWDNMEDLARQGPLSTDVDSQSSLTLMSVGSNLGYGGCGQRRQLPSIPFLSTVAHDPPENREEVGGESRAGIEEMNASVPSSTKVLIRRAVFQEKKMRGVAKGRQTTRSFDRDDSRSSPLEYSDGSPPLLSDNHYHHHRWNPMDINNNSSIGTGGTLERDSPPKPHKNSSLPSLSTWNVGGGVYYDTVRPDASGGASSSKSVGQQQRKLGFPSAARNVDGGSGVVVVGGNDEPMDVVGLAPGTPSFLGRDNDVDDGKHCSSLSAESSAAGGSDGKRKQSVAKALVILGLTRRTDAARRAQRRSGFLRSEEIGVHDYLKSRYASSASTDATSSDVSGGGGGGAAGADIRQQSRVKSVPCSFWSGGLKLPHEQAFAAFVEGLGAGQLVGRQVLGSACLGEILLQLRISEGLLQVRIERCKNLAQCCSDLKNNSKQIVPACYVKLIIYRDLSGMNMSDPLLNHGKDSPFGIRTSKSIEKVRTKLSTRSLDPVFNETLTFGDAYRNHILQILVIGERGKLDRKLFMGTVQIDMSQLQLWAGAPWITDWYKLFSSSSVLAYPCTPAVLNDKQPPRLGSNKAL